LELNNNATALSTEQQQEDISQASLPIQPLVVKDNQSEFGSKIKKVSYDIDDPYEYTAFKGYMPGDGTFWHQVWGVKPQNSINLGMWTVHLNPSSNDKDNWNNQAIMATYDMYFIATLTNSFWERTFMAGVQRNFYQNQFTENTKLILGYRFGVIYGYTGDIKDYTPLLPAAQILARIQYYSLGAELTYSGIIISSTFYFTF
jgi:hypothetical protein